MPRYKTNPEPPHNWILEDEWMAKYGRVKERGVLVVPDLPDVVSPIDGKVIHGRRGFREHFRRHNVTWADDFKEQWKKPKENPFRSRQAKQERIEALKHAVEKHTRRS